MPRSLRPHPSRAPRQTASPVRQRSLNSSRSRDASCCTASGGLDAMFTLNVRIRECRRESRDRPQRRSRRTLRPTPPASSHGSAEIEDVLEPVAYCRAMESRPRLRSSLPANRQTPVARTSCRSARPRPPGAARAIARKASVRRRGPRDVEQAHHRGSASAALRNRRPRASGAQSSTMPRFVFCRPPHGWLRRRRGSGRRRKRPLAIDLAATSALRLKSATVHP